MNTQPNRIILMGADDIQEMKALITDYLATDFAPLFQRPEWGELNFSELLHPFNARIRPIMKLLSTSDLSILSADEQKKIIKNFNSIPGSISSISEFNIQEDGAFARRTEISSRVQQSFTTFEQTVGQYLLPLFLQNSTSGEANELLEELRGKIAEAVTIQESAKDLTKTASDETTKILESMREASGLLGVGAHAGIFETHSRRLTRISIYWLVAAIGMAILALGAALYFYFNPQDLHEDISKAIQVVVAKLIIMSLLLSAAIWCGRNFRSAAHEASVNTHRANALSTFETFVQASGDEDIRNAVLLEATRSIFAQAPSGYLDKNNPSGAETNVVEILRSASATTRMASGH